jgi:transposase
MLASHCTRRQARSLRFRQPPWDEDHPDFLYLDSRLAPDHPARLVAQLLDLFDFLPLLADFYAGFGSASYHPRVYLALILFEFEQKRLSPAQWFRDSCDSLPLLWLLRGACPSRSCLYQCRDRFSPTLLEQLNAQILRLAQQQRLASAKTASLDGTFIAAKGSRHQMLNLKRLDKRLGLLQESLDADLRQQQAVVPAWMAKTHQGRLEQHQRYQQARLRLLQKIERHRKRQRRRAKKKRQGDERVTICVNETEAAIGLDKSKTVRPLYDVQVMRDVESGFILAYQVYASNSDSGLLPDMLEQTQRLSGKLPEELLADSIYASVSDLRACQEHDVVLYAPLGQDKQGEQASRRIALPVLAEAQQGQDQARQDKGEEEQKGYYGKEKFQWDEATKSYKCPAGERLERVSKGKSPRGEDDWVEVENYATKACGQCQQKEACTRSKAGRRIKRMVDEPLVQELRKRMNTEEGKAKYKKRWETIEWVFADWKEQRGLRQFNSYGLKRAQSTVALFVLLHNAKRLLQRRQAAVVAA